MTNAPIQEIITQYVATMTAAELDHLEIVCSTRRGELAQHLAQKRSLCVHEYDGTRECVYCGHRRARTAWDDPP